MYVISYSCKVPVPFNNRYVILSYDFINMSFTNYPRRNNFEQFCSYGCRKTTVKITIPHHNGWLLFYCSYKSIDRSRW